ncbi:VPLPA-CTERM sorting domain-containing protein [Arenibacterium halophilum]|uniref:VPLPA-CTERM sorting domain-containing protein n=1 Tax=Arenibacterium halophilum TaxID=2583821 RepID=A0ABY2XFM3_9RHOB|nr:VPLPA-CTERM sorting domain-containing protein [Arenibacterium halophilum]TMV15407.1 VPLPA-CTERM sorting domain-containing protein [Arenibacterium halophilum]
MKKFLLGTALAVIMPVAAVAAPVSVDLSGWQADGWKNSSSHNWQVQGSGNDSVFQSVNGQPTAFFKDGENAQGTALAGTIKVETTGDDDFIGFVLGYQDGELNSSSADFWLIDWKQGDQSPAVDGLSLSHVSGNVVVGGDPFWNHSGPVSEVQRAATLGSTGWADNTTYSFELTFTKDLIEVYVDSVLQISYSSLMHGSQFTDGSFGFYNYSQGSVRYAGITEEVLPPTPGAVPLPASAPLLLAGFGAFAAIRRRRKS